MKNYLIIVSFFIVSLTFSKTYTQSVSLGNDKYLAAIPSVELIYASAPESAGKQIKTNWCWAACIQMVLNYHGLYVHQSEVVEKVFGSKINQPADQIQMMSALSGWAYNIAGRVSSIYSSSNVNGYEELVALLENKWPLIVGLSNPNSNIGHAYVLTGVYYTYDSDGEIDPYGVILRDPWPQSVSKQTMSWEEFEDRATGVTKVWVVHH